jgi:hypothetical protein
MTLLSSRFLTTAVYCAVLFLQARVSALGGKVVVKGGSSRVMGLLAMTRAIGDHFLRPYVIPEPEVCVIVFLVPVLVGLHLGRLQLT